MVLGKYGSSQWYLNVNMWSHKYQHHQLSTKEELLREEQEQWIYLRAAVSSSSPSPVNKLHCAGRHVSTKTSHSVFLSFINSLIGHINAPSWSYAHVGGFSISFQHEFTGPLVFKITPYQTKEVNAAKERKKKKGRKEGDKWKNLGR